jgi:hypothetical protein
MVMPPSLVVTIQPAGDGTVVRADAVVDPRHGRPYEATVAKSSTGRVKRIAVVIDDQGVTWHRTLTDRGEIAEVVDAFNALPGVAMSSDPACGAMPAVPELRLTFRGTRGTLLADDHTLACGGEQVIVSGKDGAIRPALDGDVSASFREDVERMVGFDNERASATESGALLDALDASLATMTSAGVRYDSSPNADLAKPGSTSSMGEPALTRTAWWTVPLSSDAVVASLKAHLPAGYTTAGGGSWGSMSWGKTGGTMITVADALLFGPSSDAYAAPQIDLEIEDVDGGSIVRADTYISPRAAPSPQSRVAGPVSRIGVVSHTTTWGTKIATTTRRYAVTDRPTISRFVTALNAAPGVSLYPGVWNCPAANSEIRLVLTLRTGTGSVVVHAACGWGAVTVSRGGVQQGPALDVEGLAALLRQIGERR